MTRVNIIPVECLTNVHLMAEYREIRHVPAALTRSLKSKNGLGKIPDKFTLNDGHVKHFYDKGKFIVQRFYIIKDELKRRGYNISESMGEINSTVFLDNNLYNDWVPNLDACKLVARRIKQRIDEKPHLYKDKDRFLNYYNQLGEQ